MFCILQLAGKVYRADTVSIFKGLKEDVNKHVKYQQRNGNYRKQYGVSSKY